MEKLRIAKLAATKVAKAVMSSGKLDNIANSLVNKLGPHKTSTDIIHDGEEAHYLIIQTESVSLSQITSELNGENASHETTVNQLNIGYNNSKYEKLVSLLVAAMHILA